MDQTSYKEKLYASYKRVRQQTPYMAKMPFKLIDMDRGWVRFSCTMEPQFCTRHGVAASGVLAAFCDTLMGMASRTLGYKVTTMEINMNCVRDVKSGDVMTGVGQVVHQDGKVIIVECEFFDKDGAVLVKGRSSFYILGTLPLT